MPIKIQLKLSPQKAADEAFIRKQLVFQSKLSEEQITLIRLS